MAKMQMKAMFATVLALSAALAAAESDGWKSYQLAKDNISVRTRIRENVDPQGKKTVLIEYESAMTADVEFSRCVEAFKDLSAEKKWLNASASDVLETISPCEWLMYYRYDAMWPVPSSDCVARASLVLDQEAKGAEFAIVASPDSYEPKKVPRFTVFDMRFTLKDSGGGKTEIRSTATISPAINVPLPLVESGYPGAAADILRKIAKLARGRD